MTIHRRPLISLAAAIIVFSAPALATEPPTPELPTAELPTAEPPAQVQTAVGLIPDVGVKKRAQRAPAKVAVFSSRQIWRYPTHRVHEGFLVLGVGF